MCDTDFVGFFSLQHRRIDTKREGMKSPAGPAPDTGG